MEGYSENTASNRPRKLIQSSVVRDGMSVYPVSKEIGLKGTAKKLDSFPKQPKEPTYLKENGQFVLKSPHRNFKNSVARELARSAYLKARARNNYDYPRTSNSFSKILGIFLCLGVGFLSYTAFIKEKKPRTAKKFSAGSSLVNKTNLERKKRKIRVPKRVFRNPIQTQKSRGIDK